MFKEKLAGVIAAALLILLTSCLFDSNDSPTSPDNPWEGFTVHIVLSKGAISAREGELRAVAFDAYARDADDAPVANVPLWVRVRSGPGETALEDTITDEDGILAGLYFVVLPFSLTTAVIEAGIGDITDADSIQLRGTQAPVSFTFTSEPDTFIARYGDAHEGALIARVLDLRGDGIADLPVAVTLLSGRAEVGGIISTDWRGNAVTRLSFDGTWFGDLVVAATLVQSSEGDGVNSSIENSPPNRSSDADETYFADTLIIPITLASPVDLSILNSDTSFASYTGQERFAVRAQMMDTEGEPIIGQPVRFETSLAVGSVQEFALTDNRGVAEAAFTARGEPGVTFIWARFDALGLTDSMMVNVTDAPLANARLELLNPDPATWAGTPYTVKVTLSSVQGTPAVNVPTTLIDNLGNLDADIVTTDRNGIALHPYTPSRGGNERLRIRVAERLEEVGSLPFAVHQEPVRLVGMPAYAPSGNRIYRLQFQILDTLNRGVPGEEVGFAVTLGYVDRPVVLTDESGNGEVSVFRSVGSGQATLSATWRGRTAQWSLLFPANSPNSIELSVNPLEIEVPDGRGEFSTAIIRAIVRDANGDLIDEPVTVLLQLVSELQPPVGCSINGSNPMDSIVTSGGVGTALLSAGTRPHGLLIRATTWRDSLRNDPISVMLSTVAVVAGPPRSVDVDVNDPISRGGGVWVVGVTPRVWDAYRNPVGRGGWLVRYMTAPGGAVLDSARLGEGNPDRTLVFRDLAALDSIHVYVDVETRGGSIGGWGRARAALQGGTLELTSDPQTYHFENEDDVAELTIRATLTDRDGNPVNNASVLFNSTRARFYWFNEETGEYEMFFPESARMITGRTDGQHDEAPGEATVYLRGGMFDFFVDPFTLEVTVQVEAEIEGYDMAANPIFIRVTRDP